MFSINDELKIAREIALAVSEKGGRAYFVGGYVRDRLKKRELKDIDIEVHGIEADDLKDILSAIGNVLEAGKSFGIFSLKGHNLDIAMPRRERATGKGHRDLDVKTDGSMGTYEAAIRRDFTVNALMEDVLTGEITDHFGGLGDLESGILRHVDDRTFGEDPLRVLRAAQFAARFDMKIADKTIELCRTTALGALSRERVMEEMKKALIKSEKPSVFFESLRDMNQLDTWFPELKALIGIEQNPKYHSEGDAWVHTMMVLDAAAVYRHKVNNPLYFMLSALCHDYGKAVSTTVIDGVIHAYNHETEGLPIIKKFLDRITAEKELKKYVLNMCRYHMKPRILANAKSSVKATNTMFDSSSEPEALIYISEADSMGKLPPSEDKGQREFLEGRLKVYRDVMSKPYVTGSDLVDAGLVPDENFKEILEYTHKLRLACVDKESALKQALKYK